MEANILLLNGELVSLPVWQKMYNLTVGSSQIGRFFDIGEPNFRDGLTISEGIIRMLDVIRLLRGRATNANSLDRTDEDQERLKSEGYRTATYSPHVVKMAVDINTSDFDDTLELVDIIKEAAEILGYQVRIGWKSYMNDGSTFVHFDVCPMYYRLGKVYNEQSHPKVWENVIEW